MFSISATKLMDRYKKILKINLTDDTYFVIKYDEEEEKSFVSKAKRISEWFSLFAVEGNIYFEDIVTFKQFTSLANLRKLFAEKDNQWIQYRRRSETGYCWYEMELITTEDYSEDNQEVYLFVKELHDTTNKNTTQEYYVVADKILIVEDDFVQRKELASVLSDEYEVLEAENGKEAFEIFKDNYKEIIAVLTDMEMPVSNGLALLKEIRSVKKYDSVPILIATENFSEELELACLENGASEFISKPYNPKIIKNRITSLNKLRFSTAMINSLKRDSLTGLYSKPFFIKKVEEILNKNPDKNYRVVCTDIENFRMVNENYGEEVGDSVLIYLAERITDILPDVLAGGRITSDIFAFLREDKPFEPDKKEWKKFRESAPVPNLVIKYGIAIVDRTLTVQMMCDHAMVAVQSIKNNYHKAYAVYDEEMQRKILRQQQIIDNMEKALEESQFKIYYQPKYSCKAKKLCGAEALVRWIHPELGFLSPGEFIPIFEKNGFISKLDEYVREYVCRDINNWIQKGLPVVPISFNLSKRDFDADHLADSICNMADRWGVDSSLLEIEVTETVFSDDMGGIGKQIHKLRKKGFIVEIDDFGSGYSSITTLNKIELDVMKIDKSILTNNTDSKNLILEFCMGLAKILGLTIVVEGVETQEQFDMLCSTECDIIQGFFYSKPLPEEQFEQFLVG